MNEFFMQLALLLASLVITYCFTWVTVKVTKWLRDKELLGKVGEAIAYAEQMFKIDEIPMDQRKAIAIKFLRARGVKLSDDLLEMMIESAIGGVNAGIKQSEKINTIVLEECKEVPKV